MAASVCIKKLEKNDGDEKWKVSCVGKERRRFETEIFVPKDFFEWKNDPLPHKVMNINPI